MCKTSDMEIKHDTKRLLGIVRNEIYESKDLKYVETFDDGNGIGMFYCKKKLYKKNETVLHRVRLFFLLCLFKHLSQPFNTPPNPACIVWILSSNFFSKSRTAMSAFW